jgi:hypothetical protein
VWEHIVQRMQMPVSSMAVESAAVESEHNHGQNAGMCVLHPWYESPYACHGVTCMCMQCRGSAVAGVNSAGVTSAASIINTTTAAPSLSRLL